MDVGTSTSQPVNLQANMPHAHDDLLRTVGRITYPFCALVSLLKTVHIFLHYTEIVTADCFDNKQYL